MKLIQTVTAVTCLSPILSDNRVRHGYSCENSNQCVSRQCVSLCDNSSSKICMKPDWYYKRYGLEYPTCVKDAKDFPIYSARQVGETCHHDNVCKSKFCLASCSGTSWKCVESKSFYGENNVEVPKCAEDNAADKASDNNSNNSEVVKVHLGQRCKSNDECISSHCIRVCDSKPLESLCIEPRWSFEMYKIDVPSCIDQDKALQLEKLLKSSATSKMTEAVKSEAMQQYNLESESRQNVRKIKEISSSVPEKEEIHRVTKENDNANNISNEISDEKKEKKPLKDAKIDEEALAKLKKGEMKFPVEEPDANHGDNKVYSVISEYTTQLFSYLFGVQVIGFFFLLLPFVLMVLL